MKENVEIVRQITIRTLTVNLCTRLFRKSIPDTRKLINHIIIKVHLTRDSVTKVAYLM